MTEPIIKVPGMFLADAYNVPLAKTSDIFDDNNELYQDQINRDLYNSLSNKADSESIPTVNDGTFSVKTKVDNETVVAADFTANQNIADDITFIQGDNITLTTDTNNRTITISASSSPAPVDAYTKSQTNDLLNNKVDKVNGKGLSTNDYTDLEKNKLTILPDASEIKNAKDVLPFDSVVPSEISTIASVTQNEPDEIIYSSFNKKFVAVVSSEGLQMHYYEWPGYEKYVDESNNNAPYNSKVYLCGGKTYVWDGTDLVPGDGKQIQSDWNQTNPQAKDFIKNKPSIPTVPTDVSAFNNDAHYVDEQALSNATEGKADKSEMNIIEGAPDSPAEGKAIIKLKQGVSATVLTKHQDISGKANTTDVYPKTETYSKTEINNMITTPDQEYVTVTATAQTTDVTDLLPNIGSADTIYRVGSWDGTQYDDTCYSEYSWNGSAYVKLDTKNKNIGIDNKPTAGSKNPVKSGNVNGFMYVDMQPYIKELYINEAGKQADLATLHIVKASNNNFSLNFSNTAKTAFVATTGQYGSKDAASGVLPIVDFNNASILYGYTIIDWNLLSSDIDPLTPLNSICFDINYSPSIKNKYLEEDVFDKSTIKSDVDMLSEVVIGKDTAIKNFSLLGLVYSDLNTYIYFQYPKNNKINKVNQIRYKSLSGTTNFYKVTVTGATATYHLIATVTNPVSDNGIIKVLPINTQTLADNEYIGLAGSFYFGVDDNAQGFTGNHVNMSNGEISSKGEIAMGYNIEYSEALDVKIENLQLESEEVDISSYGPAEGNVISNYENVIVLASDGTGDFTSFTDAHAFCSNVTNKYNTTLVIMPGIYDIPVDTGSGYVICYNIKGVGNPVLKSYNETGNVDIKTTFSPFMMDTNTPSFHHSVSIEGITLIGKNVRYCVHDELGGLQQPSYTHVFKDCKFVHLTAPDSDWTMPRCIGGGLGNNGLIIIDNCEFKSEIATSVDYHTGFDGGAESSKVIVKDCIFANNTVSCSSTTYSSNESVMVVENCILHSEPIYNDANYNQDFKLISKNNIII